MDLGDFEEFEMEEMSNPQNSGMGSGSMFDDPLGFNDFGSPFGADSMSLPPLSSLPQNNFDHQEIIRKNQQVTQTRGRVPSLLACLLTLIVLIFIIGLLGVSIAVLVLVAELQSDIYNLKFQIQVPQNAPPAALPPNVGVY